MAAPGVRVQLATAADLGAMAALRSLWGDTPADDEQLEQRLAEWLAGEGERRTTWLAWIATEPVGLTSVFEYRRMPRAGRHDSRWGYVSNMFVREEHRNRGIGSMLLRSVVSAADERGYARLVLSPAADAVGFYRRAGFVVPDASAGEDRLLVRPRLSR
jgi:GNAT superfamily N-acetyltransferase